MKNKRIIFMGTPNFSKKVLSALIEHGYNVVLVVTQPDKLFGRKRILTPSPVKELAISHNIEVFQPLKIRNDYQRVIELKPDIIITAAYGQIIPKAILDTPIYHCVNLHASLLPKYRGGAPIQRCIINGEDKTGVSLMYMNEKMDEGNILAMEEITIDERDTSSILFDKLADLASAMIVKYLPAIFSNNLSAVRQEHEKATYAYNLKKEDEHINFNEEVKKVYNHIRGLLDNPGAYGVIEGKKYKFYDVAYTDEIYTKPGIFYGLVGDKLIIGAINGSIIVHKIQPEGKAIMEAKAFYNGYGDKVKGLKFE